MERNKINWFGMNRRNFNNPHALTISKESATVFWLSILFLIIGLYTFPYVSSVLFISFFLIYGFASGILYNRALVFEVGNLKCEGLIRCNCEKKR